MGAERLQEIGQELRRLRTSAGLSGVGLAARAGVPQPTVSRVETGRRVSDPEVVARLVGALEVGPAEAERLLGLVREAYAETSRRVDAGVSFRSGVGAELLAGARVVRAFEPVVMPRLLWTAEYAAAIGTAVAGASVLEDEDGRFVVLVAEAVLRTWPGSGECMAGQLAHLVEVSGRANVRLGIVPGAAVSRVPLHGFSVYDDAAVSVETFTRELTLTDEDEVRAYMEIFEGFERAAVFGDEARALVDQAADDLRKVLRSIH